MEQLSPEHAQDEAKVVKGLHDKRGMNYDSASRTYDIMPQIAKAVIHSAVEGTSMPPPRHDTLDDRQYGLDRTFRLQPINNGDHSRHMHAQMARDPRTGEDVQILPSDHYWYDRNR
jgi:hypothetical protein